MLFVISHFACEKKGTNENFDKPFLQVQEDTIRLLPGSNLLGRLKEIKIQEISYSPTFRVTGIVRVIPNQYAEIAAPFAGRITKSYVQLGQFVQVGAPIFEIQSPDFFEAQKQYFDAKSAYRHAEQNFARQQDLYKNGVGVKKELEAAETELEIHKTALHNAAAALKIFNVNPESLVLGQPLTIRSPIAGEVVENKIVLGQYLKEDAPPIVLIAELSKIWIAAQIKEKDLSLLQNLQDVEIEIPTFSDYPLKGRIFHISKLLDETTRSVQVIIECDNTQRHLRPGMYVNVKLIQKLQRAIQVPATSVLQQQDKNYVFVKCGPNQFVRRKVVTGAHSGENIIIESGLSVGEWIVSEGAIYLLNAK
ncbi:MAG: efflux RND transporter periplasmic adaptor subunit [Bacteroidia bacterium]|nr:efflux RND transporter periplasmic adaptor subunit [Bacteroidia bacterium]